MTGATARSILDNPISKKKTIAFWISIVSGRKLLTGPRGRRGFYCGEQSGPTKTTGTSHRHGRKGENQQRREPAGR